jgi:hypothetical protein
VDFGNKIIGKSLITWQIKKLFARLNTKKIITTRNLFCQFSFVIANLNKNGFIWKN